MALRNLVYPGRGKASLENLAHISCGWPIPVIRNPALQQEGSPMVCSKLRIYQDFDAHVDQDSRSEILEASTSDIFMSNEVPLHFADGSVELCAASASRG